MAKDIITQKRLKELLSYNTETGLFTWLVSTGKARAGSVAGTTSTNGYVYITANGTRRGAHRFAWMYVYGKFPKNDIDHINHNPADNRISNLREVTRAENMRNASLSKANTSGVTGVGLFRRDNKHHSQIMINGETIHLGYFDNFKDAVDARKKAEIKYNFHNNHGLRR